MRTSWLIAVCAIAACALYLGTAPSFAEEGSPRTGELNGTVVSVESFKAERDIIRYKLTLTTGEGEDTFIIGPYNADGYALVKTLKAGDKVRVAWLIEGRGSQKWIKSIRKIEAEGETK